MSDRYHLREAPTGRSIKGYRLLLSRSLPKAFFGQTP